jgi:hypothetical protein
VTRRQVVLSEVEIIVSISEEILPIRGNVTVTGDDAKDRVAEDLVTSQRTGNPWAWCMVKIAAVWGGFVGTAYLSGCSYSGEAAFRKTTYFLDLAEEAIQDLRRELDKTLSRLPRPTRPRVNGTTGQIRGSMDECHCCGGMFSASPVDKVAVCHSCR